MYVYRGTSTGLSSVPAVTLNGPAGPGGFFGGAMVGAGDLNDDGYDDVVIGARDADSGSGRVYVHLGSATGISSAAALALSGPDGVGTRFGSSVAAMGDLDADGHPDVAITALGAPAGLSTGRAYLFRGNTTGLSAAPDVTVDSPLTTGAWFATGAAPVDVDGDGLRDLVADHRWAGRIYAFHATAGAIETTPSSTLTAPTGTGLWFGQEFASAGDVDGDGDEELVVGIPLFDIQRGRAFLHRGSASGLETFCLTRDGPDPEAGFGWAVAGDVDTDGDGLDDVLIGAPLRMSGRVHVYRGSATGISATPASSLSGPDAGDAHFGESIAVVGDVNGDGHTDVVVGAPRPMGLARAHLFLGSATALATTASVSLDDPEAP